jgi:hypothetical protein
MSGELILVLVLLVITIALFAIGRPRMDVVANDGEVSKTNLTRLFAEANPDRLIDI